MGRNVISFDVAASSVGRSVVGGRDSEYIFLPPSFLSPSVVFVVRLVGWLLDGVFFGCGEIVMF